MKLGKGSLHRKVQPTVDGPQPAEALRQLMTSEEIQPSVGDKLAVELNRENEARADVLTRRTPGGISNRAAAVRGVLAVVDLTLTRRLEQITHWLRAECPLVKGTEEAVAYIHEYKHRQDFNKAFIRLVAEADKARKYPRHQQRQALQDAAQAFAEARDTMRAAGDDLTRRSDAATP